MKKDAYYFPHFSNARHDRKVKRITKELGVEGYGIYFMILEVLREQTDLKYPVQDIDLLADEFRTSEQKVRTVISNYDLFTIDEDEMFFSPKLFLYLEPYFNMKAQRQRAGIKSGEKRALTAKTPKEEKCDLPQVYILECYNDNERFIKIGSTSGSISRRFSGHLPYQYSVIRQIFTKNDYELEREFHDQFSDFIIKPKIKFSGDAECYKTEIISDVSNYQPQTDFSHERMFERGLNENEQSKVKKSKVKNIEQRKADFKNELLNYRNDYNDDTLKNFFNYWIEPNKTKNKMRFELEKTWDMNLRLQRWNKNNTKFESKHTNTPPYHNKQ